MISVPFTRRLTASLIAAAPAALAAHVATLFVFFVGNGFDPAVIPVANGFFGFSSIVFFVLLAVGILLTELSRWYLTLLVGVVAALLGAFVGTILSSVAVGSPLSGDLVNGVLASLGGVNLTFLAAAILATMTIAATLFERLLTARPAKLRAGRVALVRLPAANLADGAVTHIEKAEVDTDLADDQWAGYVDALRDAGWKIVEVPMADTLADSVFVEDALVVVGDLAVITRPGSEHRRAETDDVEMTVASLGMNVARITEPGTLDGGDVLQIGDTVYVGQGGRTNAEGIAQLRALLRASGRSVVAVPLNGVLHLKSAVTALPDGTVLGFGDAVDARLFPQFLEVPEAEGAHVVKLGDDSVLMSAAAPQTAALLESLGYGVVTVDISEFEKLEGCVTCLSVRIR